MENTDMEIEEYERISAELMHRRGKEMLNELVNCP